jgi:hypothetical protein
MGACDCQNEGGIEGMIKEACFVQVHAVVGCLDRLGRQKSHFIQEIGLLVADACQVIWRGLGPICLS